MIDGRIVKGVGGLYFVATEQGLFSCSVRGIFRNKKITPTVGDYVSILVADEEKRIGSIDEIKERKNFLIRPRVSNIDQVIIVFAASQPAMNVDMLDRFLILIEEQAYLHDYNLDAVICINKIELDQEEEYLQVKRIYEQVGYQVICTSTVTGQGLGDFKGLLAGKVTVFAGPSGVGKSSLINTFLTEDKMEIGELSAKISRGKHTTRHAELIELIKDSFVVDSPGFTNLSLAHIAADRLPNLFREFQPFLGKCRFHNCQHVNEPVCGVKMQVGSEIPTVRYNRYVTFLRENS